MGRASFGGAQDLSQVFAALFAQYENRLQDLALRAEDRAKKEQSAEDADMLDRWDKGKIGNKELIHYLNQRIREERTDPQQQEWLKQQLRAAQDQITERGYSDSIGKIIYGFNSGGLSGGAAGAQLRAFAEQFRHSDPDRYWSLLGQALQMEQAGATASGGSGGGGGSSSGSGGAGLDGRIDVLGGMLYRLTSLADQYYNGNKTGEITVYDRNGNVHPETVNLANPDGSPSRDLRSIHNQTLDVYDQLEKADLAKGTPESVKAAGLIANQKMDFIVNRVQPANTVKPQNQFNQLVSGFISKVAHADDYENPNDAIRNIRSSAEKLRAWATTLNTNKLSVGGPEDLPGYKGMRDTANNKSVLQAKGVEDQTTGDFSSTVQAQVEAIYKAAYSDDPKAIREALGSLDISDPTIAPVVTRLQGVGDALAEIAVVRNGLADGTWQYAMHPTLGVIPVEVDRQVTGIGPDGQPMVRAIPVMYDEKGNQIDLKDASVTTVMAKVNGDYQPVLGVAQQQTVATGSFQWNGQTYYRGQAIPSDVLSAIEKSPQASSLPIGEMQVVSTPGGMWYGLVGSGGSTSWYKDSLPDSGTPGASMPYVGRPEDVQNAADKLGLDPNHTILSNAWETGLAATPATIQGNEQRATMASDFLRQPRVVGGSFGDPTNDPISNLHQTAAALGISSRLNKMNRDLGTPDLNIAPVNIRPFNLRTFSLRTPNFKPIDTQFSSLLPKDAASQQSFIQRRTGGY